MGYNISMLFELGIVDVSNGQTQQVEISTVKWKMVTTCIEKNLC